VARWTTAHPKQLLRTIKEGIAHPGFSFIEVLSQCPTQAGRYMEGTSDPGELLTLLRKRTIAVERARSTPAPDLKGRVPVGKIHHETEKKEFSKILYENFPAEATHRQNHS
jgi:2-oxoglutarate ferredoxin oxidoreductase subunit beta